MQQTVKRQLSVRLSVFIATVFAVFLLIGGAADAEHPPASTIEYVVSAGDSLWSIAAYHSDSGGDLRDVVVAIRRSNDLSSSVIYPGQILFIPQG